MKRFIDYISCSLGLSHEQEEVIYYGLFVFITNLISILSVLLLGYMMNQLIETCLLMISYLPLRIYLGGYHCQSAQRCFVVFNIFFFILIVFMMNMKHSYFLDGLTEIFLLVILFDKKREHQQVTDFIIIGYSLLILLLSVFFYKYTYIVVLAVDFNIFLYFLSQIKKHHLS